VTKKCKNCGNEFDARYPGKNLCASCERDDIEDSIAVGGGDLE
jgi:uncharacterized OB-fold protein